MSTDSTSSPAPFGFTMAEFTRGALAALIWAVLLVSIASFPYLAIALFVIPFGFGLLLMFALPAALVGRLMRRVRNPWFHVLVWFVVGVGVAAAGLMPSIFFGAAPWPLMFIASGLATVLGWQHAAVSAGALRPWWPARTRPVLPPEPSLLPVVFGAAPETAPAPPSPTTESLSGRPFEFRAPTAFSGTAVGLSVFAFFTLLRRVTPWGTGTGLSASIDLFRALPHILITMVLASCFAAVMQYVTSRWVQWLAWTGFAVGVTLAATLVIDPFNTGSNPTDIVPVIVLVIVGTVSTLAGWAFAFRAVLFPRGRQEALPATTAGTPPVSA